MSTSSVSLHHLGTHLQALPTWRSCMKQSTNCPYMCFSVEKSKCAGHFQPNEWTFRWGWRNDCLLGGKFIKRAHTQHFILLGGRVRVSSGEIRLWTIFTVLEMAGWDGGSTVYALLTACDQGREMWGKDERMAIGQQPLGNLSWPDTDISLMWMWLCVAVWIWLLDL